MIVVLGKLNVYHTNMQAKVIRQEEERSRFGFHPEAYILDLNINGEVYTFSINGTTDISGLTFAYDEEEEAQAALPSEEWLEKKLPSLKRQQESIVEVAQRKLKAIEDFASKPRRLNLGQIITTEDT